MKLSGIVNYIGVNTEEDSLRTILMLEPDAPSLAKMEELLETKENYYSVPLKEGTGDNLGKTLIKCQSKFNVKMFENAEESDMEIEEIGRESSVEVDVAIKETTYKRKKCLVAYLGAINVVDLVEPTTYNPFI